MKIKSFLIASLAAFSLTAGAQSLSPSTKWHWDKGTIVVDTPERPAGQENVLGLKDQSCRRYVWALWVWECVVHGR